MKGLVVSVGYDDLLGITLPRNARHLTDILVVTAPGDERTQAVVKTVPSARCFVTDAFYRDGAKFNKGAAVEAAFDVLGRDGWTLIWDADVLLPDSPDWRECDPARLYGAKRRLLNDPKQWHPGFKDWKSLPLSPEYGWPGYFQLFHGSAPRLRTKRPWYATHSPHAAIGDKYFHDHWPTEEKGWLGFEVLHLGPRDVNWHGRASPRLDGEPVLLTMDQVEQCYKDANWPWKRPV